MDEDEQTTGTSAAEIIEAADGAESIETEPQTDEGTPASTSQDAAAAETEGHTPDELAELEAFFADDSEKKPDGKDDDAEPQGSRAERRIRALSQRTKQYRQQMQQQQQLHQQQLAQMQQQFQQQQTQMLQELRQFVPQQQQDTDPVSQLKAEVLTEAQKQAAGVYGAEIQALRNELQGIQRQQQQQQTLSQRRAQAQRLNQQIDAAVDQVLVPAMGGQVDSKRRDMLARMVLMTAHTERLSPMEAVKTVRSTLNGYARDSLRHGYKARGKKIEASQSTPSPAPRGRAGATGESLPEWSDLRKAGYNSCHQWEIAGRPALS